MARKNPRSLSPIHTYANVRWKSEAGRETVAASVTFLWLIPVEVYFIFFTRRRYMVYNKARLIINPPWISNPVNKAKPSVTSLRRVPYYSGNLAKKYRNCLQSVLVTTALSVIDSDSDIVVVSTFCYDRFVLMECKIILKNSFLPEGYCRLKIVWGLFLGRNMRRTKVHPRYVLT